VLRYVRCHLSSSSTLEIHGNAIMTNLPSRSPIPAVAGKTITSATVYGEVPDTSYTRRVSRVVELLQGKWTVQILCAMRARPVRLSELKRAIPSASKKALTASLRSLEAARVILRRDLSSSVLHVEYELADAKREALVALLDHLAEWGKLDDSEESSTTLPPT